MVPEQQQRILGYFIEEAKDHLNTIEQGLLNLQATISNPEMANEVFRAAHSVKGGAAMLGIESMQRTSHRMEDYFKLLKEAPIRVDRPLESMFLRVFDALQELLEQLQGPFGLTQSKEQSIMASVEPVFKQLQEHLEQLVAAADTAQPSAEVAVETPNTLTAPSPRLVEESALKLVFSSDVSAALREMLARFKQADTDDSRAALEGCCRLFERFGEQFNLPNWMNLAKHARWSVCDRNNDYRTLAPVLIKEIKKAQDLVLAGRESEISVSDALQTLSAQGDTSDITDNLDSLFASNEPDMAAAITIDDLSSPFEASTENVETAADNSDSISLDDLLNDAATSPSGPEVGAAELTSLADLFETGGDALNSDWQEEEIPLSESVSQTESLDIDIDPDFEDLLNDDASELETASNDFESGSELADLFGDADTEESADTLDTLERNLDNLNGQTTSSADDGETAQSLDASIDGLFDDVSTADVSSDIDNLFGELDPNDLALGEFDSELENITGQIDSTDSRDEQLSESIVAPVIDDLSVDVANTDDIASVDDLFTDVVSTNDETTSIDDLFADIDSADDTASADDLFAGIDNADDVASFDSLDLPETSSEGSLLDITDELGEIEALTSSETVNSDGPEDIDLTLDGSDAADLDDLLEHSQERDNTELSSADSFFFDDSTSTETAEGSSATAPQSSQFDDFFTVDEATSIAPAEEEAGSDLWDTTDSSSPAATDSQNTDDDLSDDIWADPNQSADTLEFAAEISAGQQDEGELDNNIDLMAQSSMIESDDLDLDDVWASVEDLGLDDETTATIEQPKPDTSSSSDIALDSLFGDGENVSVDNVTADLEPAEISISAETALPVDAELDNLLSDNIESDSDLDSLFGDADLLSENNPTPDAELTSLDNVELTASDIELPTSSSLDLDLESSFNKADNSSAELDMLGEPSSGDIDFDLLDLEDDGIVTGFVTDSDGLDSSDSSSVSADNLLDVPDNSAYASDLDSLDSLLSAPPEVPEETAAVSDGFGELEALIDNSEPSATPIPAETSSDPDMDDEFGDLEALLQTTDQTLATTSASSSTSYRSTNRLSARRMMTDQTMRVSVGHLDNLSNLVGELVVNRNTLEQDQERLRQFLDNLLFQVQQLNDVGQRMRDLYERSLLESSLISSRQSYQMASAGTSLERTDSEDHATGESFDALEMDRFTGFHTLSQEMIELIVRVRESASDIAYTVESSDQVTRQFRQVTNQLQEGLNKARMVPFAQTASRLPRAVRDISLKCGKEARLVVEGRDILIDKMILEQLYDPMTHLVNNAITHGVEPPEERRAAGKPSEGVITVRAFYQGNQTVISVGDDGAGIDPEIVKQKALQKGLISQADAQTMTVLDVYDLLFHPGFSTRDQADDFAGRGFGMDVVRTSLADIRGNITIDSEPGRGTNFTIRLPLTLSISKALSCISNQARIAFPMDGVEDMFDVSRERIQKNNQAQDCILWRDTLLPFQNLSDLLSFNRTLGRGRVYGGNQDENMISIVVLRSANSFIALEVDQVMGEQEIVIKQLEGPVPKPTGIAGATVLGDGRVMPIADVLELIDLAMGRVRREPNAALWAQEDTPPEEPVQVKSEPTVLIVDDSITVRELLSMSFNKVGYRVEQARDGQEAWEKLRSGLPCDLVFCDIEMPRMDGLELLSRLQKDDGLQQIPIAMLTSRGADRHRQMAVDLGASGYFTKPYLEEALLDAANKMLHGEKLV